jgi:nucleotide-binding universal stress UspA family protein
MKDLLVIKDGVSDPSPALQLAREFLKFIDGRIVLATMEKKDAGQATPDAGIQSILSGLEFEGITIEKIKLAGSWSEAILKEIGSGNYRITILSPWLAMHHEKLFAQEVLGRVISQSPCPVVVARGKIGPLERVLICDSGSDIVPILDRFMAQMNDLVSSMVEMTVLHVMSQMTAYPGVRGTQLRADAEELILEQSPEGIALEHDLEVLDAVNPHPKPKIRHGFVVDEILKELQEEDYDLLVIGAHRGERWQRYLLQNIASEVVEKSNSPVVLIP